MVAEWATRVGPGFVWPYHSTEKKIELQIPNWGGFFHSFGNESDWIQSLNILIFKVNLLLLLRPHCAQSEKCHRGWALDRESLCYIQGQSATKQSFKIKVEDYTVSPHVFDKICPKRDVYLKIFFYAKVLLLIYCIHLLCLRDLWDFIQEFVNLKETDGNPEETGEMTHENSQPPCT